MRLYDLILSAVLFMPFGCEKQNERNLAEAQGLERKDFSSFGIVDKIYDPENKVISIGFSFHDLNADMKPDIVATIRRGNVTSFKAYKNELSENSLALSPHGYTFSDFGSIKEFGNLLYHSLPGMNSDGGSDILAVEREGKYVCISLTGNEILKPVKKKEEKDQ